MPRSRVSLLGWIVAIAFILATALIIVGDLNLLATPPDLPEDTNLVDRMLGIADYRQAVWPLFLWTNLLFAIGFAASVAFAFNVASASRIAGGLPTFKALAATGGIIAAIASVIPIGAVNASVWQLYCDCGFRATEIVAGVWAQMVAEDVGVWLGRFAGIVLAVTLLALTRDARALLSPTLRTWTYITAIALVLAPVLGATEITGDPLEEELVSAITGAVLVPVWAVWLARSVDEGRGDTGPAVEIV
jgi:hypothetical protein